jgi:cytochrome c553
VTCLVEPRPVVRFRCDHCIPTLPGKATEPGFPGKICPRGHRQGASRYAYAPMLDIKSGVRHNRQSAAMRPVVNVVSEAEMRAIADWLAALK